MHVSYRKQLWQTIICKNDKQEWISGNSKLITFKAPSCILFTPEKRLHSFGYEAEYKYGQLALDKIHTSWFYFRRFKIPVLEDEVCYNICHRH
jgi:hypothetical protein